jgi:exodeoxyribonuclease-3
MKIITWNCNMAFRKKAAAILAHAPDILVVPECEHPSKLIFPEGVQRYTDALWFGSNTNKGLGIFSYGSFRLKKIRIHNPALKLIVPVTVYGGSFDFTLFAIWANNPEDPDGTYVEQVWKAIHQYEKRINKKQTVLAGDFNSNTIWDRKYRIGNHSHVVERLAKKKIESVYHLHHNQSHGTEMHPTQYMYRHQDKPYHLDYCFVSKDLADKIISVEVGGFEDWCGYSDHVPLIVDFRDQAL